MSATARFEWKRPSESWAAAASSPSLSLAPVDETEHSVEFETKALRGNTQYEVRLVTVNDANHLRAVSSAQSFTTLTAPSAPTVTTSPVTTVSPDSATVEGSVDPKGDTADWRVQLSKDPACLSGFSEERSRRSPKAATRPSPSPTS